MGWWTFVDGLLQLATLENRQVAPGIEDWVPGILTTFGFIVLVVEDIKEKRKMNAYSTCAIE